MTLQRQLSIWFIALLFLILCLWFLGDIMLPFIVGMVLAYFLDPVADMMERWGLPRLAATSIILACSILIFTLLILLLAPVLGDQIGNFADKLPGYITTLVALFNDAAPDWLKAALDRSNLNIPEKAPDIATKAAGWIATLLSSLWSGGLAIVNLISLLVVTPIVIFYMLNDWDRMVARVDGWLPREHLTTLRGLASDIDDAMAGFIRGQGTVCMVLGIFYAFALIAVGLPFGLLIGLIAGMLSFIPYVGSIIGGSLSIGMALVHFWPEWISVLMVAIIFAIGQFVEGNFLSPKLVGDRIGLHPVWLMFALFAFGYLFGFVGLLLAVPLAAAAGVLVRFALKQYLSSRLYLGPPPPSPRKKKKA